MSEAETKGQDVLEGEVVPADPAPGGPAPGGPRGRAVELPPSAVAAPGRTGQTMLQPLGAPALLLGVESEPGSTVVRVMVGGAVDLTLGDGQTWAEIIGSGIAVPGEDFVTMMIRNDGPEARSMRSAIYVEGGAAAPDQRTVMRGQPTAAPNQPHRRISASPGREPVKRVLAHASSDLNRSQRSAAAGPERRARRHAGPEDLVDVVATPMQKRRVLDLLQRKLAVPLTELPAIVHMLSDARMPAEDGSRRQGSVPLARRHVDAVLAHLQRRTPFSEETLANVEYAFAGAASVPRAVGTKAAQEISRAKEQGR